MKILLHLEEKAATRAAPCRELTEGRSAYLEKR